MSTRLIIFLIAGFLLLPSTQDQTKSRYLPMGNEAALVGTVMVNGNTSQSRVIDMSADPLCMRLNPQGTTEQIVRNGNKLQNVLVYLKSGEALKQLTFEPPNAPAVLQRKNCYFVPHVLGIRVNQPLSIENHDATFHNLHPMPKINRESNLTQAPSSPPLVKFFDRPEFAIPFRCNQHPWEKAYVAVFDHPFFATSDTLGRYQISGIPPGRYQVLAWHEALGEQETEITLVPWEVRNLEFIFAGNAK